MEKYSVKVETLEEVKTLNTTSEDMLEAYNEVSEEEGFVRILDITKDADS